jgi:ATP-binding cassette subfamily B protein
VNQLTTIDEASGSVLTIMRRGITLSRASLRGLGITVVLGLIAVAGRVVLPIALQLGVDHATQANGSLDSLLWPVAGGAVAVIVTAATTYQVSLRMYASSEAGLASARVQAFRHIHALPLVRQEAQPRGAMVSRVTSDIDTVSSFLQYKGLQLAFSGLQLIATTVVMAVYSIPLTLLVWAFQLPLILFLSRSQRWLSALFSRLQEGVADLLGVASEELSAAETIRAYSAQPYIVARGDDAVDALYAAQTRCQWGVTAAQSVAELVPSLITVAVILAGANLVERSQLSIGDLTAVLFLAVLFVTPTRTAVTAFTEAQRALAGWRRMLGVLDISAESVGAPAGNSVLAVEAASVRFDRVCFSYPGGPPVLHYITVELKAGQRVAIVGETGSGKTTFAKLACGLVQQSSGQVLIAGLPLASIDQRSLRRCVTIVPQEGFLFDATIADNVRFSVPGITDERIEEAFAELGLESWLARLPRGLQTSVGQGGSSLSAGERQLVGLARAHAADPTVLILDEATSSVDPATEEQIQQAMDNLTRGRTAIVIAHRLASASTADTILVFDNGRIAEAGSHAELLELQGVYTALHDAWIARPQAA